MKLLYFNDGCSDEELLMDGPIGFRIKSFALRALPQKPESAW